MVGRWDGYRTRPMEDEMTTKRARRKPKRNIARLADQLAEIATMTVGELSEIYREVFGEPTHSRNKDYLQKKIAWKLQEQAEGGLSQRALTRVEAIGELAPVRWRPPAQRSAPPKPTQKPTPKRDPRLPAPGTRIYRQHGGKRHAVLVRAADFEYRGRRFPNLSQIAREITGTNWNGYLFFGLAKRSRAKTGKETP